MANDYSRREFVTTIGAGVASVSGIASSERLRSDKTWVEAESPTGKSLYDAANTANGVYAVGAGGDIVTRGDTQWKKVVEFGPQARSRPLTGCDVTADGKAVWFVGGSGVIGEYNVETRTLTNYSAPNGKTSTWEDCAVVGEADRNERLYFVNGSGELLIGVRQDSGAVKYEDVLKPGGGSTIPAIDFHSRAEGHVCSTSQLVSATSDGGASWSKIGIRFAGQNFFDIGSVGPGDVNVAGGGGIMYRYDGFRWTPHVIDDERQAIRGVDRTKSGGLAAGDGGKVYRRSSAGQWRRHRTPTSNVLFSAAQGERYDVVVGSSGVILERRTDGSRAKTANASNSERTGRAANGSSAQNTTTAGSPDRVRSERSGAIELDVRIDPTEVDTYAEGEWVAPEP